MGGLDGKVAAITGAGANVIRPGLVETERVRARYIERRPDSNRKGMLDSFQEYPFGVGEPEDIANLALFLASDQSRMVDGAVIPAEGGITAY